MCEHILLAPHRGQTASSMDYRTIQGNLAITFFKTYLNYIATFIIFVYYILYIFYVYIVLSHPQ